MTPNLLVVAFIGLFILFLIESIYFLKKKLSVGPQVANQEENQNRGTFILIGGLIIIVAVIASFGWFLLSNQVGKTPSVISTKTVPTTPPSPSPNELVYSFPTVTEIPISSTITPTLKVTLTKTPTPTKIPSPTAIPSPSPKKLSPTPTAPPVGGPQVITSTTTPTPTTAIVVVPKIPVAGTMEQTLVMFFLGLSSVALGLIL